MAEPEITGRRFEVVAGTQVCAFVLSNNEVDLIMGPLGSGKTHALFARLMRHAQEQKPSTLDGLRKTRWAVTRNTYPDLKRSTIRTWLEIVPEPVYGKMNWSVPPSHRLKFRDVQCEIDFLALDKPEDVRKLRSTEYTGIVWNETQYALKELFDEGHSRLRYPPRSEGGATWHGMFGDLNAPDEDHWIAWMTGLVDMPHGMSDEDRERLGQWPKDWGFYRQPAALNEILDQHGRVVRYQTNPEAENLANLRHDYYSKQIVGKSKAWIDSRLMVRVVLVVDGSPVWPMFRSEVHVATEVLKPHADYDLVVGLDFGRQPAAIFAQAINQRVLVQYEVLGHNESSVTFAPKVRRFLAANYPDHSMDKIRFYGDPKGKDKGQAVDRTSYDIFAANGMMVRDPPGLLLNSITTRVDAVASLLNDMHNGQPRFVLSPICRTLKVAMAGRYHNEKDETGELKPCKDRYSNPADALQYLCIGMGEARRMTGRSPFGDMRPVRMYKPRSMRREVA